MHLPRQPHDFPLFFIPIQRESSGTNRVLPFIDRPIAGRLSPIKQDVESRRANSEQSRRGTRTIGKEGKRRKKRNALPINSKMTTAIGSSYGLRVASCVLRVAGCGLWVTGYGL